MYTRPDRAADRVDREAVREPHEVRRGATSPRSRPATTSARPPSCSTTRTRSQPAQLAAGHVPQHHRQRRARRTGSSPRRSRRSCRSSTRRTRSRRRPTSCTSSSKLKNFGVQHAAGRGRDRRGRRRDRRRVRRAASASPRTSGPGVDLKSEAIGLAVSLELPLRARRRAARRPVDRAADQDRAGRPAARDVRPPRRGAAADRRRAVAEPTASTPRSRRCASR